MRGRVWMLAVFFLSCKPSAQVGGVVGVDEHPTLENTTWELADYEGRIPGASTLQFTPTEHVIQAYAGCYRISGHYKLDGTGLSITPDPVTAQSDCPGNKDSESLLISILQNTDSFELAGRQLFLKNDDKVIALFVVHTNKQQ